MTVFSRRSHEGYLMMDHRASPGLSEEMAIYLGHDPKLVGSGRLYETATQGCPHCGCHVVMNPGRTRERANCQLCNMYICDWCDAARREPDYVHRTVDSIYDLVLAGWSVSGTMCRPILRKGM